MKTLPWTYERMNEIGVTLPMRIFLACNLAGFLAFVVYLYWPRRKN